MKRIEITNSARDGVPEILLSGEIEGYTADFLLDDLRHIDAPFVRMRINSCGGDVTSAYAIVSAMNAYYEQGGEIETINEAMAGSAAGWIFAFGTRGRRKMLQFAQMFLHQPRYKDDIGIDDLPEGDDRRTLLETTYAALINIFVDSTELTPDAVKSLMDNDSYINADDAISMGFADQIVRISNAPKLKNDLTPLQIVNACAALEFEIAPEGVAQQKKENNMDELAKILNLAEDADAGAIRAAVQNLRTERDEMREQRDALQGEVNNLTEAAERQMYESAVDALIVNDETLRDQRVAMIAMAKAGGVENLRSICANRVVTLEPIDNQIEPEVEGSDEQRRKADAVKFRAMSIAERKQLEGSNKAEFSKLANAYDKEFLN